MFTETSPEFLRAAVHFLIESLFFHSLIELILSSSGSRITTVRTRDEDEDPIEYGIEPASYVDGSDYFRINKDTGEVFLKKSLVGLVCMDATYLPCKAKRNNHYK